MLYHEVNIVAVSDKEQKPKTYHKNIYNAETTEALMLRVSAWATAVVDPGYVILVLGISLVDTSA